MTASRYFAVLLLLVACGDNMSSRNPSTGDADAAAGAPDAAATDAGRPDGAAEPSLVVFDNADGTFVWTPFWRYADPCCSDSGIGAYLDLRLPPASQTGEGGSLSAIRFFKEYPYPNTNWGGSSSSPGTTPNRLPRARCSPPPRMSSSKPTGKSRSCHLSRRVRATPSGRVTGG